MTCTLRAFAAVAALAVSSPVFAANLISHFEFDSDASNSSTAPDGSLVGAFIDNTTFKVGGGAARFDGFDDFVNSGTDGVPGANGGYLNGTVAFWFKAGSGIQTASRRFIGQQNGDPGSFGADNRMSFEISTNGAGSVQAFIRTADGTETNNRFKFRHEESVGDRFPTDWANGEFNHLAFAWTVDSGGNTTSQIYINGSEVGTVVTESSLEDDPVKAPLLDWEAPGMFIGARNNRIAQGGVADGHVDGWIDDFRVYDDFLSLSEIRALPGVIPEPMGCTLAVFGSLLVGARRRR